MRKQREPADLVGRPMRWLLSTRRRKNAGSYGGIIRKVDLGRGGGIRRITVQRPGGSRLVDGKTYSARCHGERVRLWPEEWEHEQAGVVYRGRRYGVAEYLGGS